MFPYRAYAEAIERRVKDQNIITAVSVIPEGRTSAQMVEELTARDGLFAIFINPQNEQHRSLTLNILHGVPQGKLHLFYNTCLNNFFFKDL